jgi:hypothetical protein
MGIEKGGDDLLNAKLEKMVIPFEKLGKLLLDNGIGVKILKTSTKSLRM